MPLAWRLRACRASGLPPNLPRLLSRLYGPLRGSGLAGGLTGSRPAAQPDAGPASSACPARKEADSGISSIRDPTTPGSPQPGDRADGGPETRAAVVAHQALEWSLGGYVRHMRPKTALQSNILAGVIAFVIYLVISLATGGAFGRAVVVGLIIGLVTFLVSFVISRAIIASRR